MSEQSAVNDGQETVNEEPTKDDDSKAGVVVFVVFALIIGFIVIFMVGRSNDDTRPSVDQVTAVPLSKQAVEKIDKIPLFIQQEIDAYVEENEDVSGDEKVYLDFDEEWAENQKRVQKETSRLGRGTPRSYYDIKVGDEKVGVLETYYSRTINVRGTVDHYTIEVFDTRYGGDYKDYDTRLVYDSVKDMK